MSGGRDLIYNGLATRGIQFKVKYLGSIFLTGDQVQLNLFGFRWFF